MFFCKILNVIIQGLIFILGRKPFDVGDRISINGPNEPPMSDGPCTWYVEEVTLYYTTLRLGATNEVATVSNSSLANSRIVNAARSTKAVVYIKLKFGIDVPTSKIEAFKDRVENFVKARPREWLSSPSIRASRVEADLGFIEYVISLHHRDSWQHMGNIVSSKADVTSYCLEVQNELEIKYVAPPTPVHLSLTKSQISLSDFKKVDSYSPSKLGI
jgi:Mechanosensitive ion channel